MADPACNAHKLPLKWITELLAQQAKNFPEYLSRLIILKRSDNYNYEYSFVFPQNVHAKVS